ncbi:MAG: hypothetical protein HC882_08455 [Acidobacteria bacterium]|nr:hypothetical protein [Acidobacteriota bacterium]
MAQLRESSFEVALGESVLSLRAAGEEVVVETTRRTVRAGLVLDSRWQPDRSAERGSAPRLVQHFAGSWVSTDAPTFDPGIATLMDFADSRDEVHFYYVLPFDEHRALVESTGFGPRPWGAERHDRCLAEHLEKRWPGRAFTVHRREQGVIPMDVRPPTRQESPGIVPIGLRGGAARPSTGYAFLGIQRQAASIAQALAEGKPVSALRPFSRSTSMLDAIFLSLARRRPGALPGVLVSLFRNADPARLVRFLAGGGSIADALHVVARTPPVPMLREAGSMLVRA